MKIPISDIKVGTRIRRKAVALDSLRASMQRVGLLHPIVVDTENNLLAGFRRLEAARSLNWQNIDVLRVAVRNKHERLLIEAEENTTRFPFTHDELRRIETLLQRYRDRGLWGRIWARLLDLWDRLWDRF